MSRLVPMSHFIVHFDDGYQMMVMAVDEKTAMNQANRTERYQRLYNSSRKIRTAVKTEEASENKDIRADQVRRIHEHNRSLNKKTEQKVRRRVRPPVPRKDKKEGHDQ